MTIYKWSSVKAREPSLLTFNWRESAGRAGTLVEPRAKKIFFGLGFGKRKKKTIFKLYLGCAENRFGTKVISDVLNKAAR